MDPRRLRLRRPLPQVEVTDELRSYMARLGMETLYHHITRVDHPISCVATCTARGATAEVVVGPSDEVSGFQAPDSIRMARAINRGTQPEETTRHADSWIDLSKNTQYVFIPDDLSFALRWQDLAIYYDGKTALTFRWLILAPHVDESVVVKKLKELFDHLLAD